MPIYNKNYKISKFNILEFISLFILFIPTYLYSIENENLIDYLKDQNFQVRVQIVDNKQSIKLLNNKGLIMNDDIGTPITSPIKVSLEDVRPAAYYYRLIIGEFRQSEYGDAALMAKNARRRLGLDLEVIKLKKDKLINSKFPDEQEIYLVATGYFESKELAQKWYEYAKRFYSAFLYKDVLKQSKGVIRILNDDGEVLGEYRNEVTIKPYIQLSTTYAEEANDSLIKWWSFSRKDRYYRGNFNIYINDDGGLDVVNALHIDAYLYGVVPSEIGDYFPMETLKAQIVVARSEILAKIATKHHFNDNRYEFCNKTHCRAYNGAGAETVRTNKAVYDTTGYVLLHDNKIVDALYSSCCGGITANAEELWGNRALSYLKSIRDRNGKQYGFDLSTENAASNWIASSPDVYCNPNNGYYVPEFAQKNFRWKKQYSKDTLNTMINKRYKVGRVKDIEVRKRSRSGRIKEIKIIGRNDTVVLKQELDIRRVFDNLYSSFFVMVKRYDSQWDLSGLTIKGAGYGHGVGMCQIGSYAMGKRGYNYQQIINHYFNDTSVSKIY